MTGRVPAVPPLDRTARPGDIRPTRWGGRHLAALGLVGLLSVGCASGGDAAPTAPTAPTASPTASAAPTAPTASTTPAPTTSAVPAAQPTAEAATVTIQNFSYAVPATVPAGATVQVRNNDGEAHTFTLQDGGNVQLVVQGRGSTATFTAPAAPGRYTVVCDFHGNMTAELVVV